VLIEGARAISLWGTPIHYNMMLQKYLGDIAPQAKDELSLSVARLLGIYNSFYFDLAMLHREPVQLIHEWQERFGLQDAEGLILTIRRGNPQRDIFEASLKRQQKRFKRWFYDDTTEFFTKLPNDVPKEEAFLMSFLLLTPDGFHINSQKTKALRAPG
jgi:hypothetical protein